MNRKNARENAFKLLFEGVSKPDESAEDIFAKSQEVGETETDDYVRDVFFGVYANLDRIDGIIEKYSVGWKKNRISPASAALLRLAVYEMLFIEDIPFKVSINEAVELSKKYDDEKAYIFVNGVLNAAAKGEEGIK